MKFEVNVTFDRTYNVEAATQEDAEEKAKSQLSRDVAMGEIEAIIQDCMDVDSFDESYDLIGE